MMAGKSKKLLFTNKDGNPMEFFMRPCQEKAEIRALIEKHGGKLSNNRYDSVIKLAAKDEISLNTSSTASSTYIHECIKANKLLNINEYRMGVIDKTSPVNDISTCVDTIMTIRVKDRKGRRKFLEVEDKLIITFIMEEKRYLDTTGNQLWKEMEKKRVTCHTWQAMKTRYRDYILPNLKNYAIPEFWISRLKGLPAVQNKNVSKEDIDIDYDETWPSEATTPPLRKNKRKALKFTVDDEHAKSLEKTDDNVRRMSLRSTDKISPKSFKSTYIVSPKSSRNADKTENSHHTTKEDINNDSDETLCSEATTPSLRNNKRKSVKVTGDIEHAKSIEKTDDNIHLMSLQSADKTHPKSLGSTYDIVCPNSSRNSNDNMHWKSLENTDNTSLNSGSELINNNFESQSSTATDFFTCDENSINETLLNTDCTLLEQIVQSTTFESKEQRQREHDMQTESIKFPKLALETTFIDVHTTPSPEMKRQSSLLDYTNIKSQLEDFEKDSEFMEMVSEVEDLMQQYNLSYHQINRVLQMNNGVYVDAICWLEHRTNSLGKPAWDEIDDIALNSNNKELVDKLIAIHGEDGIQKRLKFLNQVS